MAKPFAPPTHRDDSLEALRGLAALVVVGWHTMLAFFPQRSGLFPNFDGSEAWTGSPIFAFLNGSGAVALFFVLSGMVLTQSALVKRNYTTLLRNSVKRYPRLMLPVLCSTLISCALFKFDLYRFEQAAAVTGSPWLMKFANAFVDPIVPSWWDAIRQGLFDSFLRGGATYNSSLWTMRYEFIASFVVLAAAAAILFMWKRQPVWVCWVLIILLCALLSLSPWFLSFGLGLGIALAVAQSQGRIWQTLKPFRYVLMVVGLFLLGHLQSRGAYAWSTNFNPVFVNTLGACLLIAGVQSCQPPRGIFAKAARFLGDLSFPIYLIHIPVLCSIICWIFVQNTASDGTALRLSLVALTFLAATLASLPLIALNKFWLRNLNAGTERLLAQFTSTPLVSKLS
jgi:peptidoglycan/LPS O-acetylase OafA/YrhL